MPQMAPMWWFTLFLMFIISYLFIMMIMYFFNTYSIQTTCKKLENKFMKTNWKW